MKQCDKCFELKPESEFHRNKLYADGLKRTCRTCCALYYLNIPKEKKEQHREKLKEYEKNPERVAYRKKYAQEHQRGSLPEIARHVITHGIRDGKIQRPNVCSIAFCDRVPIEGHHPDYNKPDEVIWLCRYHHRQLHSLQKMKGE